MTRILFYPGPGAGLPPTITRCGECSSLVLAIDEDHHRAWHERTVAN